MDAHHYFATLARYNVWATRRLVDQRVGELSDEDDRCDCGLSFGSVHGTLNPLLVTGHRLQWLRFAEGISPKARLDRACPELDMVCMLQEEPKR